MHARQPSIKEGVLVIDCLVCGLDRTDCSCFDGLPELDQRPHEADRELVTLVVLDASGVLDGVPGIPSFL